MILYIAVVATTIMLTLFFIAFMILKWGDKYFERKKNEQKKWKTINDNTLCNYFFTYYIYFWVNQMKYEELDIHLKRQAKILFKKLKQKNKNVKLNELEFDCEYKSNPFSLIPTVFLVNGS